jgi:molecular chaperone HscB
MQYYEALGVEPKLALNPTDLQRSFYEHSREWHPDRFTRATPEQRQHSLDMTALINDAYRTLRDPVARAEYFLKQNGFELSKEAPPELLEEVFELNMALEEMRSGDDSARPQLESAGERFRNMLAEIDAGLEDLFTRYDAIPVKAVLEDIHSSLNRRRYISNLVREVDKELNVQLSN